MSGSLSSGGVGQQEHVLDGTTESVGMARSMTDRWLDDAGATPELHDRAALVVSELASNAVQASPHRPYRVRIEHGATPGTVSVSVESEASLSDLPDEAHWGPATPLSSRGRGLGIVRDLSRSVSVTERTEGWVTVTAELA